MPKHAQSCRACTRLALTRICSCAAVRGRERHLDWAFRAQALYDEGFQASLLAVLAVSTFSHCPGARHMEYAAAPNRPDAQQILHTSLAHLQPARSRIEWESDSQIGSLPSFMLVPTNCR